MKRLLTSVIPLFQSLQKALIIIPILFLSMKGSKWVPPVETTITVPAASGSYQALLYLPDDYGNTTTKYVLLMCFHGAGESCSPLSNIYNSTTAGMVPYLIEHNKWPTQGWYNFKDEQYYKFIVVAPQSNCNSWSSSGDDIRAMLTYLVTNYRIDVSRIYLMGLSAGAAGLTEYVSHLDPNEDAPTGANLKANPYKVAAIVPMSQASNDPTQLWANLGVADSVRMWGFGDQINDVHGDVTLDYVNDFNTAKSGMARMTDNPPFNTGHGPWAPYCDTAYKENFTWNGVTANMNIYEWMLLNQQGSASTLPTASAGSNQTIALPTTSVTLTGSGTPGAGHSITGYGWQQTSGPSSAIASPSASTTLIQNMNVTGSYVYKLTVTNDAGAQATSSVTITVNANNIQAIISPNAATITLPVSSIALDGSGSTGTITSYAWTQVSGPGTAQILSPSASSTTVQALVQGTYTFRLSVNGGTSTTTATVTVNPSAPAPGCGSGTKYIMTPFSDGTNGHDNSDGLYKGGDTLMFSGIWNGYYLDNFHAPASCPLVIINSPAGAVTFRDNFFDGSGIEEINGINLTSCDHVKITGTGAVGIQKGIIFERSKDTVYQGAPAIGMDDKIKNIEVTNCFFHNVDIAIHCEGVENCDTTQNYPHWLIDSISIHDNQVLRTWNEGFYLGNTAQDNNTREDDQRPTDCVDGTHYFLPPQNGYMLIYNNDIDSCGRGGIQISDAIQNPAGAILEVYGNRVRYSGRNGDDGQGGNIRIGKYTVANIHDNVMDHPYTFNFESLGGCGPVPIKFYNNSMDSAGVGRTYDLSQTSRLFYLPASEPTFKDSLIYPYHFFMTPELLFFVGDSGVAVPNQDSVNFQVYNNTTGYYVGHLRPDSSFHNNFTAAYQWFQNSAHPGYKKTNNLICNNLNFNGTTANIAFVTDSGATIYSTNCGALPPSVSASVTPSAITLPNSTSTVTAVASGNGGATIVSYAWIKQSGPSTYTITTASTASTTVTGLVVGTYVFQVTVTDSNGQTATSTAQVIVSPAPTITVGKIPINLKRKVIIKHP